MSHLRQYTYDIMAWRNYHKYMHQWGFEPFFTHMDYGQRFLSEYGEPVTKGRNISKLLRGIQGTIMSHTKCSVVADYTTMESFTLATDYLYRFIESWSVWGISDLITNDKFRKVGGWKRWRKI